MRTLLLSAVLYLIGIAAVLLLRPSLMFLPDGTWKEFGTLSTEHTIFPFWLFCILWALVSYLITTLAVGEGVVAAAVATNSILKKIEPPEDLVAPLPVKPKRRGATASKANAISTKYGNMKPGYYVLNSKATRESGIPKYIYIGDAPEEDVVTTGGGDDDDENDISDEDEDE